MTRRLAMAGLALAFTLWATGLIGLMPWGI